MEENGELKKLICVVLFLPIRTIYCRSTAYNTSEKGYNSRFLWAIIFIVCAYLSRPDENILTMQHCQYFLLPSNLSVLYFSDGQRQRAHRARRHAGRGGGDADGGGGCTGRRRGRFWWRRAAVRHNIACHTFGSLLLILMVIC